MVSTSANYEHKWRPYVQESRGTAYLLLITTDKDVRQDMESYTFCIPANRSQGFIRRPVRTSTAGDNKMQ